ncbi:hypothetical protein BT69DRAFT_1358331 [Atractiella rhizophila]|nr:hypothetical protein BT69DRAFT_1358331 [Atractiella rhizophila]
MVYTWGVGTGSDKWIGYQVLAGLGVGLAFMVPVNIVQAAYTGTRDVEIVTAITIFFQTLGGCFFVSISQSIYQNFLLNNLIASVPPDQVGPIIANGLSAFRKFVPPELLPVVVEAAMDALKKAFIPPIALSACLALVAPLLPWNSVKGQQVSVTA